MHLATVGLRPVEAAAFGPFFQMVQAIASGPEHLEDVATRAADDIKDMTAEGIVFEPILCCFNLAAAARRRGSFRNTLTNRRRRTEEERPALPSTPDIPPRLVSCVWMPALRAIRLGDG